MRAPARARPYEAIAVVRWNQKRTTSAKATKARGHGLRRAGYSEGAGAGHRAEDAGGSADGAQGQRRRCRGNAPWWTATIWKRSPAPWRPSARSGGLLPFFLRRRQLRAQKPLRGARGHARKAQGLNCGHCGFATCGERTPGVPCEVNSVDVGIALAPPCRAPRPSASTPASCSPPA